MRIAILCIDPLLRIFWAGIPGFLVTAMAMPRAMRLFIWLFNDKGVPSCLLQIFDRSDEYLT